MTEFHLLFNFDPIVNIPILKPVDNSKVITSLRKRADSFSYTAERINTDVSGNWTHRRQGFADNARNKKDRMIRNMNALNNLADLWESNKCPEILKNVRSEKDFDVRYPWTPNEETNKWYQREYPDYLKKAKKLGLNSLHDNEPFKAAIEKLFEVIIDPEEIRQRELDKALVALRACNIPGFFPTPDNIIDVMLEHARLEEYDSILEPSAGIGSIVDRIVERYPDTSFHITCVEQHNSLVEILKMKGYPVVYSDIFEYQAPKNDEDIICGFDKILMNPPFEKKQDIKHVMHCFTNFLKPEGKLILNCLILKFIL